MNEEQGKFLEELYHANFKRMLLELYPILKDMPSAQVAIQEAARIACQKPEEMMSSPNPAGWLRKTAGLVAKNMLREQARQKRTFLPLGSPSAGERTVRMGRQRPRIGAVVSGCRLRGGFYPVPKSDPGWLGLCGCGEGGWHFPMGLLQARGADAEKAPPRHRGAPGAIFLRPVQKQDAVYI